MNRLPASLRRAGAAIVEVEPLVRAVHLEHRPRLGRLAIERLPVEIEVVADADLAAGRVGNDVDVRVAQRRPVASHQLRARLAPADVERATTTSNRASSLSS